MSDDFRRGLDAHLAQLIGASSRWTTGSGPHPPELVRALDEATWYVTAEVERLRDLIRTHNASCESACTERGDAYCEPYVTRGRQCPDCPRDWMIDEGRSDE